MPKDSKEKYQKRVAAEKKQEQYVKRHGNVRKGCSLKKRKRCQRKKRKAS